MIINDKIHYSFETKEIIEKEELLLRKINQYATFNDDTLKYRGSDNFIHLRQYQNEVYTDVTLPDLYKDKAIFYSVDEHHILVCFPYNEASKLCIVTRIETK